MSRDAERTTSEAGSSGVAMAVTQPAWPSRVPRSESVSDILLSLFFCGGGEEKRLQLNEIEERGERAIER